MILEIACSLLTTQRNCRGSRRYERPNQWCKIVPVPTRNHDLVQGNLDITGYYTKIRRLWKELYTLDANTQCTYLCTYGGKIKMHKAEYDRKLIQFLRGLKEVYIVVRGSILMTNSLPSMVQAFTILVQKEK